MLWMSGMALRCSSAPDEKTAVRFPFPLAVTPDGKSAVFVRLAGDIQQIVSASLQGYPGVTTHFSAPSIIGELDTAADGSVYASPWARPGQVIRAVPGRNVVDTPAATQMDVSLPIAIPLPDRRVAFPSRTAGRERLLVTAPSSHPTPLVETDEETSGPGKPVGQNELAFVLGSSGSRVIGIASLSNGRVIRRLESTRGRPISSMTTLTGAIPINLGWDVAVPEKCSLCNTEAPTTAASMRSRRWAGMALTSKTVIGIRGNCSELTATWLSESPLRSR
jgi:hypothetical protein